MSLSKGEMQTNMALMERGFVGNPEKSLDNAIRKERIKFGAFLIATVITAGRGYLRSVEGFVDLEPEAFPESAAFFALSASLLTDLVSSGNKLKFLENLKNPDKSVNSLDI